eukprot:SAG22_NODE_10142_length_550_cov_1.651885_1_plen_32_part_10
MGQVLPVLTKCCEAGGDDTPTDMSDQQRAELR